MFNAIFNVIGQSVKAAADPFVILTITEDIQTTPGVDVKTQGPHGLSDGDYVTISVGDGDYDGVQGPVMVYDAHTFYLPGTAYTHDAGRGTWAAWPSAADYLLDDEFTSDAAAPLASPRTCEPGPGTLTLVQTASNFDTSGGKLEWDAAGTPAWGGTFARGGSLARVIGRAVVGTLNLGQTNKLSQFGWTSSSAGAADVGHVIQLNNNAILIPVVNLAAISVLAAYASGTDYQLAVVERSAGVFWFVKGGAFANWTLLWVSVEGTADPLYPCVNGYGSSGSLASFRVIDLPAPWNDDFGISTTRLAGSVSAGTPFTHTADCIIEWTQTTLPGAAQYSDVFLRQQDANNYWLVQIWNDGTITLYDITGGLPTLRASASAVISNGDRVVIVANGTTIRGYSNNVLRWTYATASSFATETSGAFNPGGTAWTEDGAVSDLIAWPRRPSIPAGV